MRRWLTQGGAALVAALAGLIAVPAVARAVPQVFLTGDVALVGAPAPPAPSLPVLFVHGHRSSDETMLEHYRTTWQSDRGA